MVILEQELPEGRIECKLTMKFNDALSVYLSGSEEQFTLENVDTLTKNTLASKN